MAAPSFGTSTSLPRLREFDYSVRVNLGNSAICGVKIPTMTLKLHLDRPQDVTDEQVLLELSEDRLAQVLHEFYSIRRELLQKD